MAGVTTEVLDAPLEVISNDTTWLYLTSSEATTFTQASVTYMLGYKNVYSVGAPAAGDPTGRQITCPAITDGVVDAAGTAGFYALCSDTELKATGALTATKALVTGTPFTLTSFTIRNPPAVDA
jgi:hypothetical protein